MLPTQIGKTTFLLALLACIAANDPAPAMLAGPDQDDVRKVRDDFYAICDASPLLKRLVPSSRLRNLLWLMVNGMRCYLAWSGNTQRLSGKSCKNVFCTECDKWQQKQSEGRTQDLVRERVKAFDQFFILWESTPTDEGSFIADKYEQGNKCRYLMPCPHCNHHQELRFPVHTEGPYQGYGGVAGYTAEDGKKLLSADHALQHAYYLCERGCRIEESDRAWMIANGRWVPSGQWIDRKGKLQGEPLKGPRIVSVNCESMVGRTVTFGRMAAAYIESRGDPKKEQNFDNNWRGIKRQNKTKVPEWRSIGAKLRTTYPPLSVPPQAYFLTCGTDVQKDRIYYVVRAWGPGATSWRVDRGQIWQARDTNGNLVPDSELNALRDHVLMREWPVLGGGNPVGWPALRNRVTGIDVGFDTLRIHNWMRSQRGIDLRAVRGSTHNLTPFFQCNRVEKSARDGKVYEGGLNIWEINTHTYKFDLRQRWNSSPDQPGFWWLSSLPPEEDEAYLRDITNEFERLKPSGKGTEWVCHDNQWRNDWWDCEVYARALADMVVGFEWDEASLKAMAIPHSNTQPLIDTGHVLQTEFSAR